VFNWLFGWLLDWEWERLLLRVNGSRLKSNEGTLLDSLDSRAGELLEAGAL
jgi:hypothetical protein